MTDHTTLNTLCKNYNVTFTVNLKEFQDPQVPSAVGYTCYSNARLIEGPEPTTIELFREFVRCIGVILGFSGEALVKFTERLVVEYENDI